MKKALIFGVSGQDGAYLSELLLTKGYKVFGTSRDSHINPFNSLKYLKIDKEIVLLSTALIDFRSVLKTISKVQPDEIYNLAGQSSVSLSFDQPVETFESITLATINILESIRIINPKIKFYNAGSSECFGNTLELKANENTKFCPESPYGIAKAAANWQVSYYREAYNLFASTGILFNHESVLRPERFVTKKIILAVYRIANGSKEILELGNLHIHRDWGWAPEYVQAMWQILNTSHPEDFIIATGFSMSLKDFLEKSFAAAGLDYQKHTRLNPNLSRPTDPLKISADPNKAFEKLNWRAKTYGHELVIKLLNEISTNAANLS